MCVRGYNRTAIGKLAFPPQFIKRIFFWDLGGKEMTVSLYVDGSAKEISDLVAALQDRSSHERKIDFGNMKDIAREATDRIRNSTHGTCEEETC